MLTCYTKFLLQVDKFSSIWYDLCVRLLELFWKFVNHVWLDLRFHTSIVENAEDCEQLAVVCDLLNKATKVEICD